MSNKLLLHTIPNSLVAPYAYIYLRAHASDHNKLVY